MNPPSLIPPSIILDNFTDLIRSFVCNMKRPSVKQTIKQQVSSNFQIYLGKTDEPSLPPPI